MEQNTQIQHKSKARAFTEEEIEIQGRIDQFMSGIKSQDPTSITT